MAVAAVEDDADELVVPARAETEHGQQPAAAEQGADVEAEALVDQLLVGPWQGTALVGGRPVLSGVLHGGS